MQIHTYLQLTPYVSPAQNPPLPPPFPPSRPNVLSPTILSTPTFFARFLLRFFFSTVPLSDSDESPDSESGDGGGRASLVGTEMPCGSLFVGGGSTLSPEVPPPLPFTAG